MTTSKKKGRKLSGLRRPGKKPAVVREARQQEKRLTAKPSIKTMKSFRLTDEKIRRARKILGAKSDTGTIEAALDMVIFREELLGGLEAMYGVELVAPEAMDATSR
jgi:hypothetical protein